MVLSSIYVYTYIPFSNIQHLIFAFGCRFLPCADPVMYTIVSRRESSRVEWSGKLQQHNMIDGCNQERRAGQLKRTMRRVGIERDCIKPVKVSTELKKVLFDKMLQIGECDTSIIGSDELALTRFRGRWAQVWLQIYSCNRHDVPTFSSTSDRDQALIVTKARQALDTSQIQKLDFVTSVFVWHLVTDKCLEAANTKDDEESTAADHDDDMTTNEQLADEEHESGVIKLRRVPGRQATSHAR